MKKALLTALFLGFSVVTFSQTTIDFSQGQVISSSIDNLTFSNNEQVRMDEINSSTIVETRVIDKMQVSNTDHVYKVSDTNGNYYESLPTRAQIVIGAVGIIFISHGAAQPDGSVLN